MIAKQNVKNLYPLTPMQQGMLFHHLYQPDSPAYVTQFGYAHQGDLDLVAFRGAWNQLVARHDILRTVFVHENTAEPLQIVLKTRDAAVTVEDLCSLAEPVRSARLADLVQLDRERGFDLARDPLLRVTVFLLAPQQTWVQLSFHHILLDGWSVGILQAEFEALYRALHLRQEPRLAPAPPFAPYVKFLQARDQAASLAFWERYLAGYAQPVGLPFERLEPASAQPFRDLSASLDLISSRALESLAVRLGTTLNLLCQALWGLLLARYNQVEDVVFGATVSGREHTVPEVERIVGLFINSVPVRVRAARGLSFSALVAQLQAADLEAREHHHVPLATVQSRSPLKQKLIDSVMAFENYPVQVQQSLEGGRGSIGESRMFEQTHYDYGLVLMPGETLRLKFNYNPNRFEPAQVERLPAHFINAARSVLADSEQTLAAIELLGVDERAALLRQAQGPSAPGLTSPLLAFWSQVIARPAALAICQGETELSYGELGRQVTALAEELRQRGLGAGRVVAILVAPSPCVAVAMLAVLQAGAAFSLIDPGYPPARIAAMLQLGAAALVLHDQTTAELVPGDCARLSLTDWQAGDRPLEQRPFPEAERAAYLIFTSGSTGEPKGVLLAHGALANTAAWRMRHLALDADACTMPVLSLAFDSFMADAFGSLCAGARICLPEPGKRTDLEYLAELIASRGVTHLAIVPAFYRLFIDQIPAAVSTLRAVTLGGEAVSQSLRDDHFRLCPRTALFNEYGPTEACVTAACHRLDPREQAVRIGRAIDGARLFVLDPELRPVPSGVAGELFIGGEGLARCYFDRPRETATRFLPDPFGQGQRLYRSGDRVRWGADALVFLGRADDQIKLRGFRIELGEIDRALTRFPGVRAGVTLAEGEPLALVSWVVAEPSLDLDALRAQLAAQLPEYMLPAAIVRIERLPLTAIGKLDKQALPRPQREHKPDQVLAPRTPVETLLVELWSSVLGRASVSIDDNYFSLGGDSIKAIQLVSRLRAKGYQTDVRAIFANPILAQQALVIAKVCREIPQEAVIGPLPLTPIQHWMFQQFGEFSAHFNMSMRLVARGQLDPAILAQVLQALWVHHDALRLVFPLREGRRTAHNRGPETELPFAQVSLDPSREQAHLEELAARLQASFDLETGPLIQFTHVRGRGSDQLLMTAHHLVVDAVSWRILGEDLGLGYQRLSRGEAFALPAKTDSFRAWSRALAAHARAASFAAERAYWERLDRQLPALFPPSRADFSPAAGGRQSFALDPHRTEALLTRAGQAYRTNVEDLLLTALVRAVAAWRGVSEVAVMLEGHGRENLDEERDVSRTVGWFTAMYPVVLPVLEQPASCLKAVKECLRGVPRRGLGYGLLRYLAAADAQAAPLLRPEINFNYLGQIAVEATSEADFSLDSHPGSQVDLRAPRPFPLSVSAMALPTGLVVELGYARDVLAEASIEHLASAFRQQLCELLDHCLARQTPELTPSDLTYAQLSMDELEALARRHPNQAIQDVYPLSPLQEGMLFHAQFDRSSGAYFEQMDYRIRGAFQPELFEAAWNCLFERHDILRTLFVSGQAARPLQVVLARRRVAFSLEDLSALSEDQRREQLAAYRRADQQRGFDLEHDVLLRIRVFRWDAHSWRCVWSQHHILMDGWCLGILHRELLHCYAALAAGQAPRLPSVRPYSHYIKWLESYDRQTALNHWQTYLDGVAEPTRAPFALDGGTPSAAVTSVTLQLGEACSAQARRLASELGITLNTVFQTLWGLLLQRYAGSEDVVFASTVSGRPPIEGVEHMVGLFINAVPVRIRARAGESFAELAQRVQAEALAAEPYHYGALAEIQAATALKRDLTDLLMVFENYPFESAAAPEQQAALTIDDMHLQEQTNYGFQLAVMPGHSIALCLTYDPARYAGAGIARIGGHFASLIAGVGESGQHQPAQVDLLGEEERRHLLSLGCGPALNPPHANLRAWFEARAARDADAVAVVGEDGSLRFGELRDRARALAARLRQLGAGPDQVVAIMPGRGTELALAVAAVIEAGAAYLPLESDYPLQRLEFLLADSGACALLHAGGLDERLSFAPRLHLAEPLDPQLELAERDPQPGHLAYLIYTSGSTGTPKAVQVEQRAAVHFVAGITESVYARYSPRPRVALMASIVFDASVQQILPSLMQGYPLYPCPLRVKQHGPRLLDWLRQHRIEVCDGTPSLLALMLESGLDEASDLSLRHLIIGGEALAPALIDRLFANPALADCVLTNAYGPSECCVDSTVHHFTRADRGRATVPIGAPLGGVQVYLLDAELRQVPLGLAGEICIGGSCLSRGYRNRPELDSRYVQTPMGRLYRSGDRGRWNEQGALEYLGRIDRQFKLRGYRIEPGEIEAALCSREGLRQAHVAVRGEQLIAWFCADRTLAPLELRRALEAELPRYMVPAQLIQVPEFPMNANGKLDTERLPHPELARPDADEPPQGALEVALAEVWQSVLGLTAVGRHQDFFELGGHSLKAMQVTSALARQGLAEVSLLDLFTHPTLAQLAALIQAGGVVQQALFPLRPARGGLPLFFVPPVSGTSTFYRGLAELLTPEVDPYGLQCPGFDDDQPFCPTIEALVEHFAQHIQAHWPSGPYLLAGYSMGVNLALELARRFERQGHRVSVFLIDGGLRQGTGNVTAAYADQLRTANYWDEVVALYTQGLDARHHGRIERLINHHFALFEREYRFHGQLAAAITCFEASDNTQATDMAAFSAVTTGPFRHQRVSGDHYSIFKQPQLEQLARALTAAVVADPSLAPSGVI